ncbi:hypothetical protein D3C72_773090 [compost metagenome]
MGGMKIYLQTETHYADAPAPEVRPRHLVMETAAPADKVRQMLGAVSQHLGRIAAIPAMAHEANLSAILPRDLAAHDILPGTGAEGDGEVILRVIRREGITGPAGQADVTGLAYEVV